jgi:hypothetical protein
MLGETVQLDGSGSIDPDGTIVVYRWNLEGIDIATGPTPTIALPDGSHRITLSVTDDDGAQAIDTVDIQVLAPIANDGPYQEIGGQVVIEAEHTDGRDRRSDPAGLDWRTEATAAGFSGDGYLSTAAAAGLNGTWANGCEANWQIDVAQSGTYALWMRRMIVGGGSNSGFIGVDGMQVGDTDNGYTTGWVWIKWGTVTLNPGLHTVAVRRREGGYRIDKLVLTTDGGLTPTGLGPEESHRKAGAPQ